MVHEIKLSVAKAWGIEDIDATVKAFAKEVKDWNHRNIMVEKTKDLENELEKWTPCPAPSSHEFITKAVDAKGNIDYVIKDDTQELNAARFLAKKNTLFRLVSEIESVEKAKIVPPGKERLWRIQEVEVLARDVVVMQTEAKKKKKPSPIALQATVVKKRSPKDKAHIKAQEERRDLLQKIERWAAEQHSDIEDLTEETIDAWQMVPFSI